MIATLLLAAACTQDLDYDSIAGALEAEGIERSIPGMSAAIVRDGEVVFSQGFGFADLENEVLATPETRYLLASCSKPLAAVLVMQLVEQGLVSLDAPMSDFEVPSWLTPDSARYRERPILLRHVLSHTSESVPPGDGYAYNGNVYVDVGFVLERVTRRSYPLLLQEGILDVAGMRDTTPGHCAPGSAERVELARGYARDGDEDVFVPYRITDPDPRLDLKGFGDVSTMPADVVAHRQELLGEHFTHWNECSSSGGVVSTVLDLARFDVALDSGELLSEDSREAMWTPARSADGTRLPYGLGWFVEDVRGERVLWHYGWLPPTVSALYVKVPGRRTSFFLLSNSDRLSANVSWTGVTASPFARAFLDELLD